MAEQKGVLPFSGKLGQTVGYQKGGKHFKRSKPASYQPGEESRKSGSEFGKGSKACVLLKNAFQPLILTSFKADLHNQLAGKLREVIRTGPVSKKGDRTVFDGDISLLKGFQLHPKVNFHTLCALNIKSQVKPTELQVQITAFDWGKVKAPKNADQLKIGLCCVFADFNKETAHSLNANQLSVERNQSFPGAVLKVNIPNITKEEELAVLIVLNAYFESGNGKTARIIENKSFQAAFILDAAHIKNGELVDFVAEPAIEKSLKPIAPPDVFWESIE